MNTTERLASFIRDTSYKDFNENTVSEAKKCILDGIGVTVAGSAHEGMDVLKAFVSEIGGEAQSSTLGVDSIQTSCFHAPLVNGVAGHVLNFDDTQVILGGHPTVVILPAVLALGEHKKATGQGILTSFILGVEVMCKIARGVNPYHYQTGYHVTSTIGVFGAAAAAGKLLKLSHKELVFALGIAGSMSSGLKQNFGTMTKSLHVGLAASHGVMAALLAQRGWSAATNILEGDLGFGSVMSKGCQFDRMTENLGTPWEIQSPGITRKKYPSCTRTHSAIDAILNIVGQQDIRNEDLAQIEIGTDEDAFKILIHPIPNNELEAKFSMPFCAALAFLEKDVSLKHFVSEKITDPKIQSIMKKIRHLPDPDIIAKGYESRGASKVKVRLTNGAEFVESVEICKGDPRNPLTPAELAQKFRQCTEGIFSEQKVDSILHRIAHLEQQQNMSPFVTDLISK